MALSPAQNTTSAWRQADRTIKIQSSTDPAVLERFPTVFIIGVQKAATTSLSHVLRNAENIKVSTSGQAKQFDGETHYIPTCTRRRACGTAEYASLFASNLSQTSLKLDPTPSNFASPSSPAILHAIYPPTLMPHCRLIVVLREPASRMLSWYNHRRREYWMAHPGITEPSFCGRPDLFRATRDMPSLLVHGQLTGDGASARFVPSFHTTAVCWIDWYRNMSKVFLERVALPESSSMDGMVYTNPLLTGHYASHLRRWRNAGWPRSQLLVVGFAELIEPASDALRRVVDFAGARGYTSPTLGEWNRGESIPTNAVSKFWGRVPPAGPTPLLAKMCCETWEQLRRHFAAANENLYQQLEADRSAGRAPAMEPPMARFADPSCDTECTTADLT